MHAKSFQVFILLIFGSLIVNGQSANMYKSVKIDTTRKVSSAEVLKIADRFLKRHLKEIVYDINEKTYVDEQFRKLDAEKADKMKLAKGFSSTAVLITGLGQSQNIPLILSAKAVTLFPSDTLIVNNFGGVLRMLDSIKTSLPVLLYAKQLYPNAPVILTNLGNTLFELYDDKSAENLYNRALRINPDFGLAHDGLMNVYFKRKDFRSAMTELFKNVKGGCYSQSAQEIHEKVRYSQSYNPPSMPTAPDPTNNSGQESTGTSQPNPNTKIENLRLPKFPDWSEIGAFLHDNSVEKIGKKLTNANSGAGSALDNAMKLLNMTNEQKQKWYENETKPGRVLYKGNAFAMSLMEEYFDDELDKAFREYLKTDSLSSEKFGKQIEQLTANDEAKARQMEGNPEAWQAWMVERCNAFTNLTAQYFADWKKIAAQRHNKYNDLLTTYWVYGEQYLNRTYNTQDFEELNSQRKAFVASNMGLLYTDYSFRKLTFAFSNIASFASAEGKCPQAPPPPEPSESDEDDVDIPDKDPIPCPFKDSKFKLGMGVCSAGLDCESIELECGEGLIGAGKWNYKNKEFTGFIGVGTKANFGIGPNRKGPIKELNESFNAEFEAKGGFQLTFNKQGQVIDGGIKTEFGAKVNAGSYSAGGTYEITATAATGINGQYTNELALKAF
jgi:tetratricopeptide (TPR) repeat protein